MKFILATVVCLIGAVFSAPAHQSVQNSIIQSAPQSHGSAGDHGAEQTVQNAIVQSAPQSHGSAGDHGAEQTVQNTIAQLAPQSHGSSGHPVKQTVQNLIRQSTDESEVDASELSLVHTPEMSSITYGKPAKSSDVFGDASSNTQKIAVAPMGQSWMLSLVNVPQQEETHDDSEAHASEPEQQTLYGSNGGYVY